jgi:hypothetical protein
VRYAGKSRPSRYASSFIHAEIDFGTMWKQSPSQQNLGNYPSSLYPAFFTSFPLQPRIGECPFAAQVAGLKDVFAA